VYSDVSAGTSITWLRKIDIFGNMVKEQLSCCNEETITPTETDCWALPATVTKGAAGGPQITVTSQFDFNTSAIKFSHDPNNLETEYGYDAAMRTTSIEAPTGAISTSSYNDGQLSASRTVTYIDGGTQKQVTRSTVYDGWGQTIQEFNEHGGQINTSYDAMGRGVTRTNPFPAGGTPGPATSYQYDALGRVKQVTLPDNNTIQTAYAGSTVTVTDQVNRKTQRISDGLGRLATVNEQDVTGALTQATNYSYNYLDGLTQVNQGNQLRSFKYDSLGRLLYEKIPEQTATSNDGTGTFWTTKYTYTTFNSVATEQDARGVITTYTYDSLNRPTTISYNTVSGVTTAPTVTYRYDSDSTYGTTATGKLVRVNVGSDYQERYTFDSYERVASAIFTIGTRTYTTGYQYNQRNQRKQAGHMGYSYDSAGRLSAVGNSFYNASYNVAGQLTGDTLYSSGLNGATLVDSVTAETFGYDANRMQLTSQTAATTNTNRPNQVCIPSCPPPPPGGTNLNLTYSYQASAGQMGAGTTAGNAGQLMSITGTIGGVVESASFTYDLLGRLTTSNQTSNAQNAQRRFAYDRWGNRTGVYDPGNHDIQIQEVTLEQSGGAPTNRITSVTAGSTLNYVYDATGNVTSDGTHSYTYDSENRLVSVDGGATAQYSYDHRNRRYKKAIGATVTHYIWEGSRVLGEYDGATGALQVNYWYAGGRLFKKTGIATQLFLSDRLSVRLALSEIGVVAGRQGHLPFGEDFAESGTQEKHHFTGYERDTETGTDYATNRQLAPNVGRFMRVDLAPGSTGDPQGLNRYAYVQSDPINAADPSGLNRCIVGQNVESGQLRLIACWGDPSSSGDDFDPDTTFRGGPRTPSLVNNKAKKMLKKFLEKNPGCEGVINQKAQEAGVDLNLSNVWDSTMRFLDARDSSALSSTMFSLGFPGYAANDPLTLSQKLTAADATTNPVTRTVYLGEGFYGLGGPDQNRTVLHEMLHAIFYNGNSLDGGHVGVATALGIAVGSLEDFRKKYPGTPDSILEKLRDLDASELLNDFLDNNCGVARN